MNEHPNDLFKLIFESVKNKDALKLDKSSDLSLENNVKEDTDPFTERNKKYNELIDSYTKAFTERNNFKHTYKKRFFWFVIALYILVISSSLFIMIASLYIENTSVAIVIGALGSLITSLVAIPTIIANYLFPKKEDSNLVDMFKNIFDFDTNYYNSINAAKTKATKKAVEDEKKEKLIK